MDNIVLRFTFLCQNLFPIFVPAFDLIKLIFLKKNIISSSNIKTLTHSVNIDKNCQRAYTKI